MNAAFFLTPRQQVSCLYDDFSLRQGLEKMRHHGYTAVPVVTRENKYVGTVSEGDFLWHILEEGECGCIELKDTEKMPLREIIDPGKNPPVKITAKLPELILRAENQNFIPVVDDLGSFIGIITRKSILKYFDGALPQEDLLKKYTRSSQKSAG